MKYFLLLSRLAEENKWVEDIDNVVQPDLSVVCDEAKLDDSGCIGAPDMIAEVIPFIC
ncbi:hypothetical protein [Lentibacillus juripiscarius]|uniref:hypothetical protein n=1 Tax=Lentibacillus juripiscarius TaxID=257446 RepID=UPI0036D33689